MTDARKDGGPAFPEFDHYTDTVTPGMTLRDYFAVHCDQPGEAEIVSAAGLYWEDGMVVLPDGPDSFDSRVTFMKWWWKLPMNERSALYAKVRYALADAMLAERSK